MHNCDGAEIEQLRGNCRFLGGYDDASAEMALQTDSSEQCLREGLAFGAVGHVLVCFVECNYATDVAALFEEEVQTDVEQGASRFGGHAWTAQVNNGELTRLECSCQYCMYRSEVL